MSKRYLSLILCFLVTSHTIAIESNHSWPKSDDLGFVSLNSAEFQLADTQQSQSSQALSNAQPNAQPNHQKQKKALQYRRPQINCLF